MAASGWGLAAGISITSIFIIFLLLVNITITWVLYKTKRGHKNKSVVRKSVSVKFLWEESYSSGATLTIDKQLDNHDNRWHYWQDNRQVVCSTPGWPSLCSGLGQATYTCVPLSPSSIKWYWPNGPIFLARNVTAGPVESNGNLSMGLWLSPAGWLLWAQRSWLSMGQFYFYITVKYIINYY